MAIRIDPHLPARKGSSRPTDERIDKLLQKIRTAHLEPDQYLRPDPHAFQTSQNFRDELPAHITPIIRSVSHSIFNTIIDGISKCWNNFLNTIRKSCQSSSHSPDRPAEILLPKPTSTAYISPWKPSPTPMPAQPVRHAKCKKNPALHVLPTIPEVSEASPANIVPAPEKAPRSVALLQTAEPAVTPQITALLEDESRRRQEKELQDRKEARTFTPAEMVKRIEETQRRQGVSTSALSSTSPKLKDATQPSTGSTPPQDYSYIKTPEDIDRLWNGTFDPIAARYE